MPSHFPGCWIHGCDATACPTYRQNFIDTIYAELCDAPAPTPTPPPATRAADAAPLPRAIARLKGKRHAP